MEIYFEEGLECSFVLCEATVSNPAVRNVAFLTQSFQVSTYLDQYGQHPASLANDGNRQTNANVTVNGCAVSRPANNPWWAIDLGGPTVVCLVKLTNRGDANGKFLTDLQVTLNFEVSPRHRLVCLEKVNVIIFPGSLHIASGMQRVTFLANCDARPCRQETIKKRIDIRLLIIFSENNNHEEYSC